MYSKELDSWKTSWKESPYLNAGSGSKYLRKDKFINIELWDEKKFSSLINFLSDNGWKVTGSGRKEIEIYTPKRGFIERNFKKDDIVSVFYADLSWDNEKDIVVKYDVGLMDKKFYFRGYVTFKNGRYDGLDVDIYEDGKIDTIKKYELGMLKYRSDVMDCDPSIWGENEKTGYELEIDIDNNIEIIKDYDEETCTKSKMIIEDSIDPLIIKEADLKKSEHCYGDIRGGKYYYETEIIEEKDLH